MDSSLKNQFFFCSFGFRLLVGSAFSFPGIEESGFLPRNQEKRVYFVVIAQRAGGSFVIHQPTGAAVEVLKIRQISSWFCGRVQFRKISHCPKKYLKKQSLSRIKKTETTVSIWFLGQIFNIVSKSRRHTRTVSSVPTDTNYFCHSAGLRKEKNG